MYKGVITSPVAITAGSVVPFQTKLNTNGNTSSVSGSGVVDIRSTGYYDIDAVISLTGVAAGEVVVTLLANGTVIPEATVTATSGAITDYIPIPIRDVIKVVPSNSNTANISISVNVAATVASGVLTVEKLR